MTAAVCSIEKLCKRCFSTLASEYGCGRPLKPPVALSRSWSMPSPETFKIPPIAALLDRWCDGRSAVVDPFCRTSQRAHYSNDLAPEFGAGVDAPEYLSGLLARHGRFADCLLLDPPYSPRQMAEAYKSVGLRKGIEASQNARLYSRCRDLMTEIALPGAVGINFGWNSGGFGIKRGWRLEEVLLVAHGGAHNDTICTVERYEPEETP